MTPLGALRASAHFVSDSGPMTWRAAVESRGELVLRKDARLSERRLAVTLDERPGVGGDCGTSCGSECRTLAKPFEDHCL